MANGVGALLTLLGKVDANHALVVVSDDSQGGGPLTRPSPIGTLQGKVDSSNRLVVKFVV